MKKLVAIIALLILTVSLTELNAQPFGKGKLNMGATKGTKFVDANGDGVCDNLNAVSGTTASQARPNFVDANGDGVCDNNTGTATGAGNRNQGKTKPNFVDANGDGVCDNNTGTGTGVGTGAGKRNQGKTKPNFIDEDGDGICDKLRK